MNQKLWIDLNSDLERAEFIESGDAWKTGILAPAMEKEFAAAFRAKAKTHRLLEALKGVVAVADRKTVEFDAARAAIAEAEK